MSLRPNRRDRCSLRSSLSVLVLLFPAAVLVGCGTTPKSAVTEPAATRNTSKTASTDLPALPRAGSGRGGYYQDDGPGDAPPPGLLDTPDPEPKIEPYSNRGNKPYTVFGKTYTPMLNEQPFKQRGIGSWYGKKFHGQKTSSGEPYDMYKMSAAHPTLPIPSYVRVTNIANGKQVIVRVNDRGPFHSSRIIDLSYTAALKLGYLGKGSSELEIERLLPADIARINAGKREALVRTEQSIPTPEVIAAAANVVPAASVTSAMPVGSEIPVADKKNELPPLTLPVDLDRPQVLATAVVTAAPVTVTEQAGAAGTPATLGFYLQLGAFGQKANAHAARERLLQNSTGALPAVEVVEAGALYRLYGGPFGSRADAAAAAQRLQDAGGGKAMIVQR